MLGDGVLVESIDLRRLRQSAAGNDLLRDRFDRCPEASGEKNPGPLARKGACDSTAGATSGSVDDSILALWDHSEDLLWSLLQTLCMKHLCYMVVFYAVSLGQSMIQCSEYMSDRPNRSRVWMS